MGKTFADKIEFPKMEIENPGVDMVLFAKKVTGLDHKRLLASTGITDGSMASYCDFLSGTLLDENGDSPTVDQLMEWPITIIAELFEKVLAMNNIGAQAKEELEKN